MGLLAITKKDKNTSSSKEHIEPWPEISQSELRVTDSAAKKIHELLNGQTEGAFMRVGIVGGGCSGFSYHFAIENEAAPNDLIFENKTVRVCVDPKSIKLLGGSLLEWHEELGSNGFRLRNKHETKSCSCGKSFSL